VNNAEEYRKRAFAAEASAATTADDALRRRFIDLASEWRRLAEQAETGIGRSRPPADGSSS